MASATAISATVYPQVLGALKTYKLLDGSPHPAPLASWPSPEYEVTGHFLGGTSGDVVAYAAAAPASLMSGLQSGMPYVEPSQAFHNTPNRGKIVLGDNGHFTVKLHVPNSFYIGRVKIEPTVYMRMLSPRSGPVVAIRLGNAIPFRNFYDCEQKRADPVNFYRWQNVPQRSTAEDLVTGTYPLTNQEPANFWGDRIPRFIM